MLDEDRHWQAEGAFARRLRTRYGHPAKRAFDVAVALALLPVLVLVAVVLWCLNPFCNHGPVFYRQERMGLGCRPFAILKFRTMDSRSAGARGAYAPVEVTRITRLGVLLRRARLDELPQIVNVLRGEMSMIGPRPDTYANALVYLREVPGYRARHLVLPGISGLAQTECGYAESAGDIARKVAADLRYLDRASLGFDLWIVWRTFVVICAGRGV